MGAGARTSVLRALEERALGAPPSLRTLPRTRAPSLMPMRGAVKSPTTRPVSVITTASVPVTSPWTEPPITIRAPESVDHHRVGTEREVAADADIPFDAPQDFERAFSANIAANDR